MTKQSYEHRSSRSPRWEIAGNNLLILEFLFWEKVKNNDDRGCAEFVPHVVMEAARRDVRAPEPWTMDLAAELHTALATQAISMLKDLPKVSELNGEYFSHTKTVLWAEVIRGWLKTSTKAVEFGQYLLTVNARDYSEANCKEFEKVLQKELETNDPAKRPQYCLRIRNLLAYAAETANKDGKTYRDETVRILAHAFVRYAGTLSIAEKFQNH